MTKSNKSKFEISSFSTEINLFNSSIDIIVNFYVIVVIVYFALKTACLIINRLIVLGEFLKELYICKFKINQIPIKIFYFNFVFVLPLFEIDQVSRCVKNLKINF